MRAGFILTIWLLRHRNEIAVIHAQALTGLNLVAPGALLTRIPVVVRVSDPEGSRWGRRLGPLLRAAIPELRIAPVSETALAVAVENGLCSPEEALVVPNPVDPSEVKAIRDSGEDKIRIAFLGSSSPRKGYDILEGAISRLEGKPIEWRLFMRQPTDGAPHPPQVQFLGRVSDVRVAYSTADIVFVPSRSESFCRVVAESMVNGIPVVASDIEPIRDLLGGEAGLLFPVGDVAAASQSLALLVDDAELRSEMGSAGQRRSLALTPDRIAERIGGLYAPFAL
jgi:glycosyltransferase involved in cell wall biosynthesis